MVVVSDYVVLRFQMRGDMPTVTKNRIQNMWVDSDSVGSDEKLNVEKRYNKEYSVLFIAENGVIKTVLRTEYLNVYESGSVCEWCEKVIREKESCRKCNGWKFD